MQWRNQFKPQVWTDRSKPPPDPNIHTALTVMCWCVLLVFALEAFTFARGWVGVETGWWVVQSEQCDHQLCSDWQ